MTIAELRFKSRMIVTDVTKYTGAALRVYVSMPLYPEDPEVTYQ